MSVKFNTFVSMTNDLFYTNSKQRSINLLISILLIIVSHCYSQNTLKFEHLSTENGLSQSDVNTIFQDDNRFMWFGTHDGLNRYDGYNFTIFKPDSKNPKSISSNLIWKIIGDDKGNLWIGTTGGGLNYFDKKQNNLKRLNTTLKMTIA